MSKFNKPNFLIVGVARSGTTSLAKYLNQHSDIFIPQKFKEPKYFVREAIKEISFWDPMYSGIMDSSILEKKEYFNLFNTTKEYAMYGEASIFYLNHPDLAIRNIKNTVGDIPILIILRNPIDRMISNWKYITSDYFDFYYSLKLEKKRKYMGYNSFWLYKYQSLYYEKVKKYINNFSSVKIIIFEKFIANTENILTECTKFLGLPNWQFDVSAIHNKSKNKYYINKNKIYHLINSRFLYKSITEIMHRVNIVKFRNLFSSKDSVVINKKILHKYFKEDISKLEKLINQDLTIWKP